MDGRSVLGSRASPHSEALSAKRLRRADAPSGADTSSEQEGADRCHFSSPTPIELDARTAEGLVEALPEPMAGTQLEETSGTTKHLQVCTGLPSGVVDSFRSIGIAERIRPFNNGDFRDGGKRLEKQAEKVRETLAGASAHASDAREAARVLFTPDVPV
eukprot:CAMPEP_0174696114 /NCGR_PEP_ID=MMETSP1094-20130205/2348_1 /TAXON_ID=156173 /ORGANISM="Chrysochromulina brevifilum, Strain UTEX LB 985" /LENGTH=158 /DNA_ID=CAMNT_0015892811 /DNA_START=6 /DNA_END=482 /DNA_ORIENTATION=-